LARVLLLLAAGCSFVTLGSSTEPAQATALPSLGILALSQASSGVFFDGRADPSLAYRLLDRVQLQSEPVGNLCRAGAASKKPLNLAHHSIDQHRRTACHARSVKSFRALLPIGLHRPLHADGRHPEGADDVALLDVTAGAELTGDHAKRCDVVLGMAEHRHVPVEVRDLTILLHEGQLVRDVGYPIGKYGQLKLRHGRSRAPKQHADGHSQNPRDSASRRAMSGSPFLCKTLMRRAIC